jgi:hypothetical protein
MYVPLPIVISISNLELPHTSFPTMGCACCKSNSEYGVGFGAIVPCLIPIIGLIVACAVEIPILVLANGQGES